MRFLRMNEREAGTSAKGGDRSIVRSGESFRQLIAVLAEVAAAIGSPAFNSVLVSALNKLVRVDHCTVFAFRQRKPLGYLLPEDRIEPTTRRELAEDYLGGFYMADPNFALLAGDPKFPDPSVLTFDQKRLPRRYRERFFVENHLVDKISCLNWRAGRCFYCNFYRMVSSGKYTRRDHQRLRAVLPLIANLIAVHCQILPGLMRMDPSAQAWEGDEEMAMFERLGPSDLDRLTAREREVCLGILSGYTSEAIALRLGVAPSTVVTFRKRAYRKLGICSQNELFSLYIKSLAGSDASGRP